MRLFFALTLPPKVRATVVSWQKLWSESAANVKWVQKENLDLTLKFLGEVASDQLDLIISTVRPAIAEQSMFTLTLKGAGAFPHFGRARVLWLGLEEGIDQLTMLHYRLERELSSLNYLSERKPFKPHLTLGRLRMPTELTAPALPEAELIVPVKSVVLYESIIKTGSVVYKPLATFQLQ